MEGDVHLLIPILAMEFEQERRAAARRRAIERQLAPATGPRRSSARRRLALALAAVSRTSAGAVRRLDACLADDLLATLASSR
jgi:hypothetical protein